MITEQKWLEVNPSPPCKHIWIRVKAEENAARTARRHTHRCPKCGRVKVTVHPLRKRRKRK